jgi:hypothetical protein
MTGCSDELAVMLRAADGAAQLLRDQFARPERLRVDEKSASDFVSSADLRSQEIIRGALSGAYPAYAQLLEEGTSDGPAAPPGARFIVDRWTAPPTSCTASLTSRCRSRSRGRRAGGGVVRRREGDIRVKGKGAWLDTPIRSSERQLAIAVGTGILTGKPPSSLRRRARRGHAPVAASAHGVGGAHFRVRAAGRLRRSSGSARAVGRRAARCWCARGNRHRRRRPTDRNRLGRYPGELVPSLHRNMVDWLTPLHG